MKTLPEQLLSLRREVALRRNVYPRWVSLGKLTKEKAHHEIECMEAAVQTVQKVLLLAETSEEMKRSASQPQRT